MTERVRALVAQLASLSPDEREEFDLAYFERLEHEPLDEELGREAARRLRETRQGGPLGPLVDDYFDALEARSRSESA